MKPKGNKIGCEINIPGFKNLLIKHLVFDYNGTLAYKGVIIDGVIERFNKLNNFFDLHVITADTFGIVKEQLNQINVNITIIKDEEQDMQKKKYVENLGGNNVIAFGNGRNDALMLNTAVVGIAVIMQEGCSATAIKNADIISKDIIEALDLIINNKSLIATLRN